MSEKKLHLELHFAAIVDDGDVLFELELVNVANVKISSSNVAKFHLGIGIGIGNISTLATFTSV